MEPELGVTVAVEALIERYKGAEQQIAVALESAVPVLPDGTATDNRNVNRQFRRSQQRNMEAYIANVLSQLDEDTAAFVRAQLPTTYINGVAKIALATDSTMPVAWNLMHRQAVSIIAQDVMDDLAAATTHMQAQAKAFIRKAAKAEVLDQIATGRAAAIGRRLAKELASEGLQGFVDASGRRWRLSSYAQMVVRTKRQAAFNTGATLRMHQQGVAAALIIDGTRHDSDCTAINGKTCSVAWSLDHPLEHPQCTRTFAPLSPPPETLDYGSYDDELPLSQLGKKQPNDQLLYREPPTIRPAANPVRAGQLAAQAADAADVADVSQLTGLAAQAIDIDLDPNAGKFEQMGDLASQLGIPEADLDLIDGDTLNALEAVWNGLDTPGKATALKQAVDKAKAAAPKPVVQLPGGLGEILAEEIDDNKALGFAQFVEEAAYPAFVAKDYQAIYQAAVKLDQLADALDDLPQLSSGVAKIIRSKAAKLETAADAIAKEHDSALKAAAKAADAASLSDMAKATYTPKASGVLPDPDWTRPGDVPAPQHVIDHSNDWAKAITHMERNAVSDYTGSSYEWINRRLRTGTSTAGDATVEAIDSALGKAGNLPEPTLVWRGVRFSEVSGSDWQQRADWAEANFVPGSTIEWKAYSSTSTTPRVAADSFGGGGVVFEIEATRGVSIKPLSSFKSENEVLLPRGSRFEVVRVIRSAPFSSGPRTVVQLRQLP